MKKTGRGGGVIKNLVHECPSGQRKFAQSRLDLRIFQYKHINSFGLLWNEKAGCIDVWHVAQNCSPKIDLAPHVGASLEVMDRDVRKMRRDRLFLFTNLKNGTGVVELTAWVRCQLDTPEKSCRTLATWGESHYRFQRDCWLRVPEPTSAAASTLAVINFAGFLHAALVNKRITLPSGGTYTW